MFLGEDDDSPLPDSWVRYLTFVITVVSMLALVLLTACSTTVAPNLKLPEQKACRSIALPPVPQKVKLIIDGDKIESDQGGEQLLRGYVAARYLFRLEGAK